MPLLVHFGGAPFLMANAPAYLARAFGGPGDLQHAWSSFYMI